MMSIGTTDLHEVVKFYNSKENWRHSQTASMSEPASYNI